MKRVVPAVIAAVLAAPATAQAVDLKPISIHQASGFAKKIAKRYCDRDRGCESYLWSKPGGCTRYDRLRVICQVGKEKYSGRRCYRTVLISHSDRRYFWRGLGWRCN